MAKRGRPPKKTRLDKTKALGSAGFKGLLGLGGILGLSGSSNLEEGIRTGDASEMYTGAAETAGGIYALNQLLKSLGKKTKAGKALKGVGQLLENIPGGRSFKKLVKNKLPFQDTLTKPVFLAPIAATNLAAEQAIEETIDKDKPPTKTYLDMLRLSGRDQNIFKADPRFLEPAEVITKEVSKEEKDKNLQLANLTSYDDAPKTEKAFDYITTNEIEEPVVNETEQPTTEVVEENIPVLTDQTDTDEEATKENIKDNAQAEQIDREETNDPSNEILNELESQVTAVDSTIKVGSGDNEDDPRIVLEDGDEETKVIEPVNRLNIQENLDQMKDPENAIANIMASPMDIENYTEAANEYKKNAMTSIALLKKFEKDNPRVKLTWDEYREKFGGEIQNDTKDFILLKFGLGLMSARTDLPGFSGFMDILGRVGGQAVDELQQVYEAERLNRQRMQQSFAQYEMQIQESGRQDKLNMLNASLGVYNKLSNDLIGLKIKSIDNKYSLDMKRIEQEANIKIKKMEVYESIAKQRLEIDKDRADKMGIKDNTLNNFTNIYNGEGLLGGVGYMTALTKDNQLLVKSNFIETQKGEIIPNPGVTLDYIPVRDHNRMVLTKVDQQNKKIKVLKDTVKTLEPKLQTINIGEKKNVVVTQTLFDQYKDRPGFNVTQEMVNQNININTQIEQAKAAIVTETEKRISYQDSVFDTNNMSSPAKKVDIPKHIPSALTSANLALLQAEDVQNLIAFADDKGSEVVGFRGRLMEMFLGFKDIANIGDQEQVPIEQIQSEALAKGLTHLNKNIEYVDDDGNVSTVMQEIQKRLDAKEDIEFTSIQEKLIDKATGLLDSGQKLSEGAKRAIQARLRVLETVLVFQLANALKEEDRLTEANIRSAKELLPLFQFAGLGTVKSKVDATILTIKEKATSNMKVAFDSGMNENRIESLAPYIYKQLKQKNLRERANAELGLPRGKSAAEMINDIQNQIREAM